MPSALVEQPLPARLLERLGVDPVDVHRQPVCEARRGARASFRLLYESSSSTYLPTMWIVSSSSGA